MVTARKGYPWAHFQEFVFVQTKSTGGSNDQVKTDPLGINQYWKIIKIISQVIPVSSTAPRFKAYLGDINVSGIIAAAPNGNTYESYPLEVLQGPNQHLQFQWLDITTANLQLTATVLYNVPLWTP